MDIEPAVPSPERVHNLWFDNENVVIKAQAKLFRLSRGILTQQSPIFADMFRIPQPPDMQMVDGCPLVEIPDSADDAAVFFSSYF